MCEELGDEEYMQAYVEEMGATSLCSAADGAGCSEKEVGFIEKCKAKDAEALAKDLARLQGMTGQSMKPDLKKWLSQRIAVHKQLVPPEAMVELYGAGGARRRAAAASGSTAGPGAGALVWARGGRHPAEAAARACPMTPLAKSPAEMQAGLMWIGRRVRPSLLYSFRRPTSVNYRKK